MDRGVHYPFAVPAIPAAIKNDVVNLHELGVWARVEQDFSKWSTLGFRWDMYTPDTSLADDARNTFAVVGVVHINELLQAMLEYDHAIDHVHASGKRRPISRSRSGPACSRRGSSARAPRPSRRARS